jgi:hypothetical protein
VAITKEMKQEAAEEAERRKSHRDRLPFNQPTGSQSAALGPIIKRTFANKKSGPSKKTQGTTLAAFAAIAAGNHGPAVGRCGAFHRASQPCRFRSMSGEIFDHNDSLNVTRPATSGYFVEDSMNRVVEWTCLKAMKSMTSTTRGE